MTCQAILRRPVPGGFAGCSGTDSGCHPAMIRACIRACALSSISGNRRRNSTAAANSPPCLNAARIAAASSSLTVNIARAWKHAPQATSEHCITASRRRGLRENVNLAMDGVPEQIARNDVLAFLRAQPEVAELHDLHIWGLSTTDTALTADLVIAPQAVRDDLLLRLETDIARRERAHPGHPRHQKRARP